MKYKFPVIQLITITCAVLSLSSCGGGSSSASPTSVSQQPPPQQPPQDNESVTIPTFSTVTQMSGLLFASGYSSALAEDARFFSGGGAAGDIDGDGDIDLVITRGNVGPTLVYVNDAGTFNEQSQAAGLASILVNGQNPELSGPCLADMDGDTDLDLFLGGVGGNPSFIFANDGHGVFTDVTPGSGIDTITSLNTVSCALGDYDRDGYLDLALSHWGTPRDADAPGDTETLWRNISQNNVIKFESVSIESGIADELELSLGGVLGPNHDYTFSPNFADINGDRWPDLLNVSDFLGTLVFLNNQDGTFTNITDRTQITDGNGMGAALGDYDNDGDLDWFVSAINSNRLYNNQAGVFAATPEAAGTLVGAWGWGSCFADFNGDGYLDIYQTNGWRDSGASANPDEPFTRDTTRLWISSRDGQFFNAAEQAQVNDMSQGRGVICADFDGDHDIDVLQLISTAEQGARLLRNDSSDVMGLTVELIGRAPNTQALGARIFVETNDLTQMREVAVGSNFTSHNPSLAIFGLGQAQQADEVRVIWPDGSETVRENVAGNQRITFTSP